MSSPLNAPRAAAAAGTDTGTSVAAKRPTEGPIKDGKTLPYRAKEAAFFCQQGACLVAMPPDEAWVDPLGTVKERGN